jgi:hypothetical protein
MSHPFDDVSGADGEPQQPMVRATDPMKDACDCDGEEYHRRVADCPTPQEHEISTGKGDKLPVQSQSTPPKETWQERFDKRYSYQILGSWGEDIKSFFTSLLDEARKEGEKKGWNNCLNGGGVTKDEEQKFYRHIHSTGNPPSTK